MDVYQLNFAGLMAMCAVLFFAQRRSTHDTPKDEPSFSELKNSKQQKVVNASEVSQRAFLTVFALVMASDWLQGPFLYSLYIEEYAVPATTVPTLFTTGFLSGAISASVIGTLADKHGRKAACLVFCAAYALSCLLTILTPSIPLLFAGRILGGISTSLLFSVFESWMVTDFHARKLGEIGGDLSRTFGIMSTLNSVVAIVAGVWSEWLVGATGTRKAPFAAAAALLVLAGWLIATRWDENYGHAVQKRGEEDSKQSKKHGLWEMLKDPRIFCLGLTSTIFEGSMYLFVFFWGSTLASARRHEAETSPNSSTTNLPYGLIFASFMASVLVASLAFNLVMDRRWLKYTHLLSGIFLASEFVFYVLEHPRTEQVSFWLFCLFEACVGIYWPCMGYLKGQLIEDGVRAQLYGMLRVPLNGFVIVALYWTRDYGEEAYVEVFGICSRLFLAAMVAICTIVMKVEGLP